jgi:hypothetical protein
MRPEGAGRARAPTLALHHGARNVCVIRKKRYEAIDVSLGFKGSECVDELVCKL